ncbi:Tip20p KNAG_0I00700 [Huiozyma naganishii CBS 8797]|uniref:Uncharacterized protein n=1 Tax=Huiozyma naganishii (strain ATCC MYA-139 / BCRC 22969 / CBS 8797 / KCTC 17520 / NBRC 10181 / NCYC 3082 / Yp74L-3) TaxID=1071383 RepID=J7SA21_HUIN7|nr:hypothetical protein KNAG_0I00700 [Kazachstania naganishii CBS 8797]CCK71861.1 hypothetical protein KNAG_0I00700 [Kazachstania naganishii CBS 8797]
MNDIKDLVNIDAKIDSISQQRDDLSKELDRVEKLRQIAANRDQYYQTITDDIQNNAHTLENIEELREKYGDLLILQELESNLIQQMAFTANLDELRSFQKKVLQLSALEVADIRFQEIEILYNNLQSILSEGHLLKDDNIVRAILNECDHNLLDKYGKHLLQQFNEKLLHIQWDTPRFLLSDNETVSELRKASSHLYQVANLYSLDTNRTLWNFKALTHNFQIRFTYHFHDNSSDIKLYFKYLNDYLKENLYKCINIFEDSSVGLEPGIVHEQFINHVLQPMRDHVNLSLGKINLRSLIMLISQIVATDKNLITAFHYHGDGLVSLVSDNIWESWINYETETITKQFTVITKEPKDLFQSGPNFVTLLKKAYEYFEPFYELDHQPILKYKLKTCSQIFMALTTKYLQYVLTTDTLGEKRTKEAELEQTMTKLELLNMVYQKVFELSGMDIFIKLTKLVNETESEEYITLLQNILKDYENDMEFDLQNSIIHRIQKLVKESLKTYFKTESWVLSETLNDAPKTEVISAINLLRKVITKLSALNIPENILFNIKNELLNIIVNYFLESILKLNRFNQQGLAQFNLDFCAVKDTLELPEDLYNVQEAILLEILKVLTLKYDSHVSKFISSSYIKNGEFQSLRDYLSIRWLKDTEIQDALYRVSYGNII